MRRRGVVLAVLVLASVPACRRAGGQADGASAATPQPIAAAQPAAAHQHAQPTAAAPMEQDTGDARVRHNRGFLVSADSLAARLARGGTVVIHVGRNDSAYLAGHVPGARFLLLSTVATTVNGIPNQFPSVETMANAFSSLVIRPEDRIVLYGDDPGIFAARAWAALDMMGHGDRAALLDGGLTAWRAGNRRVDTGPVPLVRMYIPFPATWRPEKVVDAAWVRAHLGDSTVVFVDARSEEQYNGTDAPCVPGQTNCTQIPEARLGHLPGAKSLYWLRTLVSRENPVLRPMHELHHELWQAAGADEPWVRTVVVYCRTGMQASHGYFTARYVGYRDVRLYDGSFLEWAGMPAQQHPVSRGDARTGEHQHH